MNVCLTCGRLFDDSTAKCPNDGEELLPHDPSLADGAELAGKYTIVRAVGLGQCGEVYEARETASGDRVVLRLIAEDLTKDRRAMDMLRRHLLKARDFKHAAVVATRLVDQHDGRLLLVRDWVEGERLQDLLSREGALPIPRALAIGERLCGMLAEAHRAGLLHLQIRASNLFVAPDADGAGIRVLDFGLGPLRKVGGRPVYGTLRSLSPEQIEGKIPSFKSDIFSTGLLIFRMVVGRSAFAGTEEELARRVLEEPVPPLKTPAGEPVPPALDALVHQMVEKKPTARPTGMNQVLERLHKLPGTAADTRGAPPASAAPSATASEPLRPQLERSTVEMELFSPRHDHTKALTPISRRDPAPEPGKAVGPATEPADTQATPPAPPPAETPAAPVPVAEGKRPAPPPSAGRAGPRLLPRPPVGAKTGERKEISAEAAEAEADRTAEIEPEILDDFSPPAPTAPVPEAPAADAAPAASTTGFPQQAVLATDIVAPEGPPRRGLSKKTLLVGGVAAAVVLIVILVIAFRSCGGTKTTGAGADAAAEATGASVEDAAEATSALPTVDAGDVPAATAEETGPEADIPVDIGAAEAEAEEEEEAAADVEAETAEEADVEPEADATEEAEGLEEAAADAGTGEAATATGASADSLLASGYRALADRQFSRAQSAFERALALEPGNRRARIGLGKIAFQQGRFADAVRYLEPVYRGTGNMDLGVAYVRVNRLQDAKRQFERILARDPGNADARRALDAVNRQLGL